MTVVVPTADARMPRARAYHAGRAITLDTNLLSVSGASAWAIDEYLKATTSLPPLGTAFITYAASIDSTARFIKEAYLTPHGRWWGGRPTLRSMQQFWSSSHRWGINVRRIASAIHLDTLTRRRISFAAPIVSGPLHPGERASVELTWVGGAIPAGV